MWRTSQPGRTIWVARDLQQEFCPRVNQRPGASDRSSSTPNQSVTSRTVAWRDGVDASAKARTPVWTSTSTPFWTAEEDELDSKIAATA